MSAPAPVRLQRSRKKGARLVSPNGLPVVYVGRGSKWGNPHAMGGKAWGDRQAAKIESGDRECLTH